MRVKTWAGWLTFFFTAALGIGAVSLPAANEEERECRGQTAQAFMHRGFDLSLTYLAGLLQDPKPHYRPFTINRFDRYLERPEEFYFLPEGIPEITFTEVKRNKNFTENFFRYPSPIVSPFPENNTCQGYYFAATNGANQPTIILAHGWKLGFEYGVMHDLGARIASRGWNAYLFTEPYHSGRAPKGTYSGELMISADLEGTVAAVRQAVCDLRALISYVKARHQGPVILSGISLGGFVTSLTVGMDDRIDFALPIISGDSLADAIYFSRLDPCIRNELLSHGVTFETASHAWAVITPSNFKPKIPKDRILMVAGCFDPFVRPATVEAQWNKWERPKLVWLPSAHISNFFEMDNILALMEDALIKVKP